MAGGLVGVLIWDQEKAFNYFESALFKIWLIDLEIDCGGDTLIFSFLKSI